MTEGNVRRDAVLLVGPTGSGKSPLGRLLEETGLRGRPCLHFDFGEALRASAHRSGGQLTAAEREVVEASLRTGSLLEDEHFPIAEKLLADYVTSRGAGDDTVVVLNGLPRHVGQAKAVAATLGVRLAVSLECGPGITWERIRTNAGGDRSDRGDDTLEEVSRRLEMFSMRTAPLLEYYRCSGIPVVPLEVGAKSMARDLRRQLDTGWPAALRWSRPAAEGVVRRR